LASRDPPTVRREIKPSNIFVKGQSCVLGDFGLLKRVDGLTEHDRDVFKETVGLGMPHDYRTPDLVAYARGEAVPTASSDVFQLGLVLTELFTGRNPCRPARDGDTLAPVELDQIGHIPYADGGLVATILKSMLDLDPSTRPTAAALLGNWIGAFDKVAEQSRALSGVVFADR
jgi:serine/threonine protein kinase